MDTKITQSVLSTAQLAQKYLMAQDLQTNIDNIKGIIRKNCTLTLPENSPQELFLRKITGRKLKYSRPKIFTLNYDLLFEQAAAKGGYVVIDGFSFTYPRQFNGINFDYDIVKRKTNKALSEENYTSKVFHLYKPHGSLDWEKNESGIITKEKNPTYPLMIYPSNTKYEASYEQPFFEMMSRFQQELRQDNTILIVIGFSFGDKHLKAMIDEALSTNLSLTLVIVSPDVYDIKKYNDYKKRSQRSGNVILINEKFDDFAKYYHESDIYISQDEYSGDTK